MSSLTSHSCRTIADFRRAESSDSLGESHYAACCKPFEEHKFQDIHVPKHEPDVLRIFDEACADKGPHRALSIALEGI